MEEKNVIIIVAVVAGSLFVIVIVGLIIFIVIHRRRKRLRSDGAPKDAPRSRLHLGFGQCDSSSSEGALDLNRPTNNFDRVVSNNYVSTEILNYGHRKSAADGNLNKVLPPVAAKAKLTLDSDGSFRGKENSGFVSEGKVLPALPAKPKLTLDADGSFRGIENSGSVSEGKVPPAVPAKPTLTLDADGSFRGKENSGFVSKVPSAFPAKPKMKLVANRSTPGTENDGFASRSKVLPFDVPAISKMKLKANGSYPGKENNRFASESKVFPSVPAKPKRTPMGDGSSRGKDNSGFVSDDSGYTTLDTTVRSADSSLYLTQKLKHDMDIKFKNSQKRIRVMDSDNTGPYAVIDILDLKNRNSRASASGPWPSADYPVSRYQLDVTPRKPSQTRENIYFELEKQSDISEDDSECEDSFDVAQSRTSSNAWQIGELQETDV